MTVVNVATGLAGSNLEIAPTAQPFAPVCRCATHNIPSCNVTSVSGPTNVPAGNMSADKIVITFPLESICLIFGGSVGSMTPASQTQTVSAENAIAVG